MFTYHHDIKCFLSVNSHDTSILFSINHTSVHCALLTYMKSVCYVLQIFLNLHLVHTHLWNSEVQTCHPLYKP